MIILSLKACSVHVALLRACGRWRTCSGCSRKATNRSGTKSGSCTWQPMNLRRNSSCWKPSLRRALFGWYTGEASISGLPCFVVRNNAVQYRSNCKMVSFRFEQLCCGWFSMLRLMYSCHVCICWDLPQQGDFVLCIVLKYLYLRIYL